MNLADVERMIVGSPLVAEAFHRTSAVEFWGCGTNRVIEACARHGIEAPIFEGCGPSVRILTALMAPVGWTNHTRFRAQMIRPLLEAGRLEMTVPEKPRGSQQRYQTTTAESVVVGNHRGRSK